MSRRRTLDRRTFLRGAGTVAIALPFLEPMMRGHARAGAAEPPERCITAFFGLGVPKAMQMEGFSGPLAPLSPYADRLAMFRNVDMSEAGGQGHPKGGTCVFVGAEGPSGERAGGPSIDQVVKRALYPDGAPTPIGTLAVGSFFRRSHGLYQRIRCWGEDGGRVVEPIESPALLFDGLFGSVPDPGGETATPEEARRRRLRRSVLDTVMGEYAHHTSDASGLGEGTRRRIRDHLERLRELERRVFAEPTAPTSTCTVPPRPVEPALRYGFAGATEYDAVRVPAADFQRAFRQLVDLYAMALRCDLVRFGNVMFESSGGHTAFEGTYDAGTHRYDFRSEASDHNNWHEGRTEHIRWHAHFFQSQMAYLLSALDDDAYREENGGTILDNSLLVMGTETGTNHDMNGVFHAVAGGRGRLRLGGFRDESVHAVDIYNTCLRAVGVDRVMGSAEHFGGEIAGLLA
ncbi:MAG: DUF1552 domain-containing protein [Myxococcota bacterium]|nr:DUF1552 domain-containing protein [Myxococcota bacterium]